MDARRLGVVAVAFVLTGCTVGPDYRPPEMQLPAQYRSVRGPAGSGLSPMEAAPAAPAATREAGTSTEIAGPSGATPATTADLATWWRGFGDDALNRLVDRAMAGNLDLRRAEARLREARALLAAERSGFFPQLDARGSVARSRQSQSRDPLPGQSSESTLWRAGFDAGWEIDVFGGTRRAVEAARAELSAAEEDRNAVLTSLLAEVATNYITLRGVQQQLRIAFDNIQSQRQTRDFNRARFEAGLVSELDVTRSEAQLASFEATVPALRVAEVNAIHRLAVLLGVAPGVLRDELGEVPDGEARQPGAIPMALPEVPVGLPSDLLRRRPDIRRAERRLAAATARIGIATADFFPRFSLTGSLGTQGSEVPRLVESRSIFWSVGPSVSWNVFDAGRVRANIAAQSARQEQALTDYQRVVLQSLEEVENAVTSYTRNVERRAALVRAVEASRRSVELAAGRFAGGEGLGDLLDVLLAQRDLFQAEDALVRIETQLSADLVALYKALGGGWAAPHATAEAGVKTSSRAD